MVIDVSASTKPGSISRSKVDVVHLDASNEMPAIFAILRPESHLRTVGDSSLAICFDLNDPALRKCV